MSNLYAASLGVGLTSSAFLTFSQLGAAHFGIMPLIMNDAARRQAQLNIQQSVRAWDFFFTKATVPVAVCIFAQTIGYGIAAYLKSPSTERTLLWFASATGFLPLPYTLALIIPSINALQKLSQRASTESLSESEEKVAMEKLQEWNSRHFIRMGIYISTLVAALSAILPGLSL